MTKPEDEPEDRPTLTGHHDDLMAIIDQAALVNGWPHDHCAKTIAEVAFHAGANAMLQVIGAVDGSAPVLASVADQLRREIDCLLLQRDLVKPLGKADA